MTSVQYMLYACNFYIISTVYFVALDYSEKLFTRA